MFIIDLHYIVPLEKIDTHMAEHMVYLRTHYKQQDFIVSGRKVPRTGGIIVAQAASREALDAIIQKDPFYIHKLAEFTVTEFQASQSLPEIKKILEK